MKKFINLVKWNFLPIVFVFGFTMAISSPHLINTAQDSGNVFMIMGKDGKPSGAYIKVDDIDMEKFGNIKDSIE